MEVRLYENAKTFTLIMVQISTTRNIFEQLCLHTMPLRWSKVATTIEKVFPTIVENRISVYVIGSFECMFNRLLQIKP